MTLEDQITALLAEAEPLRLLAEDDPAKAALGGIVERINALRDMQARGVVLRPSIRVEKSNYGYGPDVERPPEEEASAATPKRRGRPPKARIEGDDA